jgi:hypothetical protein
LELIVSGILPIPFFGGFGGGDNTTGEQTPTPTDSSVGPSMTGMFESTDDSDSPFLPDEEPENDSGGWFDGFLDDD